MKNNKIRLKIYSAVLFVLMVILVIALFYNQVIRYGMFKVMSEENRLRLVPLMAPRGTIYDRNMVQMVKDVLCFDVSIVYSRIKGVESAPAVIASILDVPVSDINKKIKKAAKRAFTPLCIAQNIGIEKAIKIEEINQKYPGLILNVSAKRQYLEGKVAANVLGYLGYINSAEFERLKPYGYQVNDLVGRAGIEKYYDKYLRGTHGGKQIEVDHLGREVKVLGVKEPVAGRDLVLTIDERLQAFCDSLLVGKKGAIVVMDPRSGAVLAMSSAPTYNPDIFINSGKTDEVRAVLRDKNYPLLNRAISGTYPPGSVFKTVVASAALETGVSTPATVYVCNGVFSLGRAKFHCWRRSGHGPQDMLSALKNSCNIYFFNTGLHVGSENIAKYAGKFGLGRRTGIDLPGERAGTLPSPEWKKKVLKNNWYKGDTVNYSIGQGYLLCSPIQIACMMGVFANSGFLVKPFLVSKIGDVNVASVQKSDVGFSPSTIDVVREGLYRVVNGRHGTGSKARLNDVVVCGKTGTAQTYRGKNHGWFAGFAPRKDPKIVVVVFDEFGGKGGYYAAGTASKIFRKARELGIL